MTKQNLPVLHSDSGFSQYMAEIRKFPMLEAEEEYMLAKRWSEHGDYDAAHRLVTSHLRLVAKIAQGFRGYGLPVTDLVAEGNIGLMQAVKKFEPEKGFRLSTYAMWWIRAAIQEYILKSWSVVKVGTSAAQKRLFFNLKKMKNRIGAVDQNSLSDEQIAEIAEELDVSARDVVDMDQRMTANDRFLNAPAGDDSKSDWIDLLEDDSESHEVILANREEQDNKRSMLYDAMDALNARERDIIMKRRLAEDPQTLEELSQTYEVSRERIRQIEARAMEKLTAAVTEMAALPSAA